MRSGQSQAGTGRQPGSGAGQAEVLAPGGGVGREQAAKSRLQVLIGSLRLAIRPGGQAGRRPN